MNNRIIFHIDVNSAFLSWEAVYRLHHLGAQEDLRQQVSAVGGDQSKRHGIILAKSIPAKQYHIQTGESIKAALEKCPELILVRPNYELYKRCSRAFMDILREYSPVVEPYSIDEAFVDMTGTRFLWGDPVTAAHTIRKRISGELGFTVNIGISSNKLLAKIASDFTKPDRVHTLFPEEIPDKLWPLPVGDMLFCGQSTVKRLHRIGIYTIGELAAADPHMLQVHLGKQGFYLWGSAHGTDLSQVTVEAAPNKGYGNSTTMSMDITDAGEARLVLLTLAEKVGQRLRADEAKAQVVDVTIRDTDLVFTNHQMRLPHPTNITQELYTSACTLFEELWDGRPIRHLGIHTSQVIYGDADRQIGLEDDLFHEERQEQMDRTVDRIRHKYGQNAVQRAAVTEG
ncbi:MAG: DNA polymerase IV [Clostridiales bacterium]|nr:DNA polymerase IV [Clostridiales bacterium]